MAEDTSIKEIEDGIKQILKIGSAMSDGPSLQQQSSSKESSHQASKGPDSHPYKDKKKKPKKNKKGHVQESTGGGSPSQTVGSPRPQHHQADPPAQKTVEKTEENAKPSQKKKKKKQKTKEATEKVVEKDMPETDSDSDDAIPLPKKKSVPIPLHVKYLDDKLTSAIMQELESERIFPLKKKSLKFVHAKYFCRLCDYHCDNVPVCRQHYNDARHRRRKEIMLQDKKLKNLPSPSDRHAAALDEMVHEMTDTYGLSEEDLQSRLDIVKSLELFLQQHIAGSSLCMYGSSLSGFGLKSSDLNIDLILPGDMLLSKGLIAVYQLLLKSDDYKNVTSDFHAKVPTVIFRPPCGSVQCKMTIDNKSAYYTSLYLKLYHHLDPRLKSLAVVFKYWAKICQVDQQESGSLPAYTFTLMTIYFLQQCKPPVLPILWKDISESALKGPRTTEAVLAALEELKKEASTWKSTNNLGVGTLWRNMLVFYGVRFDLSEFIISIRQLEPLHRSDRKWKSKKVAVEDPFYCKRNVARSLYNNRIFDYFYNCLRKACLYFSLPTSHPDLTNYYRCKRKTTHKAKRLELDHITHDNNTDEKLSQGNTPDVPTQGNKPDVPSQDDLLICKSKTDVELCENDNTDDSKKPKGSYKDESNSEETSKDGSEAGPRSLASNSLELDQSDIHTEVDVKPGTSTCADKAELVPSLSDTIDELKPADSGKVLEDQVADRDKDHPFVSSTDTTQSEASIPLHEFVTQIVTCDESDSISLSNTDNVLEPESADDSSSVKVPVSIPSDYKDNCDDIQVEDVKKENTEGNKKSEDIGHSVEDTSSSLCDTGSEADSDTSTDSSSLKNRKKKVSSPVGAEYDFEFSVSSLTDGKGPSIFCQLCDKEGHLKSNCPDDQLPPLEDLQPVTKQHLKLLTSTVKRVPRDFRLTPIEVEERERIRKDLEDYIQENFPDAELCLFGSSMNGFGFHQSDLDICVTFKQRKQEELNYVEVIEEICKKLKSHRGLYNVFPITTAKVPIVKFKHRASQLEGDISLYNILAQHNTNLLLTYANIDPRVQTMGYAIKVFAKVCDIGDASKGSLSSYAYMLMMFHYLQNTKPPVIPVLQEMGEDNEKGEVMVDGCNAWFFKDLDKLPTVWNLYGKNQQSVGELWLGFFRYYLEEFNLQEQVITIRQSQPLTKFEKLWNGKCVAIEDPFDLNHNLGGGLSRKMNKYIQQAFIHARRLYGTSVESIPDGFKTMEDYFFDNKQLTDGEPPSDRLCRVCSKIGHIARECPRLTARKQREANEKKRKDDQRAADEERNMSTPKKNRERQGYGRSNSESYDPNSPGRPRGQQVYYRQTSDHLNDHHRGHPLMDGNIESPPRTRYPGTPPHGHHMSQERHAHSQDRHAHSQDRHAHSQDRHTHSQPPSPYSHQGQGPTHYNQGPQMRQWLFQSSPRGQQQFRGNQNDNSSRRYAVPSNNYQSSQYADYRGTAGYGSRGFPANGNGDYNNPANQRQAGNRAGARDTRYQVPVNSYMNAQTGIFPAYISSPLMQMQANVMAGLLSNHNSMNNPISVGQPVTNCTGTSQPGSGNITDQQNTAPVYIQSWYPMAPPVPGFMLQPLEVGSQAIGCQQTADVQGDGPGQERSVNIQKGTRASNVGVTVRNEYYRGKE